MLFYLILLCLIPSLTLTKPVDSIETLSSRLRRQDAHVMAAAQGKVWEVPGDRRPPREFESQGRKFYYVFQVIKSLY